MTRLERTFDALKRKGRAAFVPFIMGGDPSFGVSLKLLRGLPAAGADIIEIGVAFTDPMADGLIIQAAGLRALSSGQTLAKTLDLVRAFRTGDTETPIVLMGYYNPFYAYGVERFLVDAIDAGVDGLIVVDLPPEEDEELCLPALRAGINFIRLATPTTDEERLPAVLKNATGFVYYVSVAGITGGAAGVRADVTRSVRTIGKTSNLPVAVGFGIKNSEMARETAKFADAVVVGSALVERLAQTAASLGLEQSDGNDDIVVSETLDFAHELASAVHAARGDE